MCIQVAYNNINLQVAYNTFVNKRHPPPQKKRNHVHDGDTIMWYKIASY